MREEPRRDEQHDCHRDLGDDERSTNPFARHRATLRSLRLRERVAQLATHPPPRGDHAHADRRDRRDADREQEHLPVHAHFVHARQVPRLQREQELHAGEGHRNAKHRGAQGKEERLGETLLHHPRAAGTERDAERYLRLSRGHPRNQQVHHVRARDEQQQERAGEEDRECALRAADDLFLERHECDVLHVRQAPMLFEKAPCDRADVGARLLERDSVGEPADDLPVVRAPTRQPWRAAPAASTPRRPPESPRSAA